MKVFVPKSSKVLAALEVAQAVINPPVITSNAQAIMFLSALGEDLTGTPSCGLPANLTTYRKILPSLQKIVSNLPPYKAFDELVRALKLKL